LTNLIVAWGHSSSSWKYLPIRLTDGEVPLKKILLYEDEPDLTGYFREFFAGKADVLVCNDAKSVENIIGCVKIDLIITSLEKKKSDFKVILPLVHSKFPDLPVIILNKESCMVKQTRGIGQVVLLPAPFNKFDLEECIGKKLDATS